MKKKTFILALSLCLLVCCTAGITIAWLTDKTDPVKNTFTTSDIGVELTETTQNYVMIPGHDIAKDPRASITTGSQPAWLFVKVEKSANFDTYMTYAMADGWTLVEGTTNVYARKVTTDDIGTEYSVLKDDKVTVKSDVTKTMMEAVKENQPTLTITAYASQLMKDTTTEFTAKDAWANVPSTPAETP